MTNKDRAGEAKKKILTHRTHTRIPEEYEKAEELKQRAERDRKQLTSDYRNTFNSEAGVRVLRDLAAVCGQHKTSVCGSVVDGTLDLVGTMHNEAMRKVYLHIRSFLNPSTLAKVENDA